MSLSIFKSLACCTPPIAGAGDSHSLVQLSNLKLINIQAHSPPLQTKGKEKSVLQESLSITSRREMIQLTAASVGLFPLLLPGPAAAGPKNATVRERFMEILEELKRMDGFFKPKDDGEEKKPKDDGEEKKPKDETEGKSEVQSSTKEAKPRPKHEEKETKGGNEAKAQVEHDGKKTKTETTDEKVAPVIPALPDIINDKPVETSLPS